SHAPVSHIVGRPFRLPPGFARRWAAFLALALLLLQVAVPWSTRHYVSQDGASHLYTAVVFKDLLLHPHGLYASVYRFQPRLVTNWASLVLLSIISSIFSAAHAEQVLTTGLAITAFLCFVYFRRSVDPSVSAWDPLTNFLINTWFFWIGF